MSISYRVVLRLPSALVSASIVIAWGTGEVKYVEHEGWRREGKRGGRDGQGGRGKKDKENDYQVLCAVLLPGMMYFSTC